MKLKLISDGTPSGTFLVDEATGEEVENVITKIVWEADAKDNIVAKTTIYMANVPVEIASDANVDLLEYKQNEYKTGWEPVHTKSFEKFITASHNNPGTGLVSSPRIFDGGTNVVVGAIQNITWEATPEECKANITKIMFDRKEWV